MFDWVDRILAHHDFSESYMGSVIETEWQEGNCQGESDAYTGFVLKAMGKIKDYESRRLLDPIPVSVMANVRAHVEEVISTRIKNAVKAANK